MAQGSRNTTGSLVRQLQLGLDKIIDHFGKDYISPCSSLFKDVKTEKGFFELMVMAGMTPAGRRNEGAAIASFDTINQDQNPRYTIYSWEKSARATEEAIEDNLYEDLPSLMGKAVAEAHKINEDIQCVSILNNSTVDVWGDGVALLSTAHPLQAGGTSSNRLSPDLDLSLDAIQQAVLTNQAIKNPNGQISTFDTEMLVVPTALQFIADVILNSRYKTGSANNDINPINRRGDIKDYMVIRRLSGATTWFVTTTQEEGLIMADRKGMSLKIFEDNFTHDTVVTATKRFRVLVADWRRVIGSVGP